jgi:hypothetical protein
MSTGGVVVLRRHGLIGGELQFLLGRIVVHVDVNVHVPSTAHRKQQISVDERQLSHEKYRQVRHHTYPWIGPIIRCLGFEA